MKTENSHIKNSLFGNWQLESSLNKNLIEGLKNDHNLESKERIPFLTQCKSRIIFPSQTLIYGLKSCVWVLPLALTLTRCVHLGIHLSAWGCFSLYRRRGVD